MINATDVIAIVCRALGLSAALQAAGLLIFLRLFSRHVQPLSAGIARLCLWSALAGIALTILQQALGPARMTANLSGVLDFSLQALSARSNVGLAHAVRLVGLGLILCATIGRKRGINVGVAGTVMVAASFTLMGHTTTHEPRWALAALLFAHVLIIAFWLGSLLPLSLCAAARSTRSVVSSFSRIAIFCVPLILVAGVLMAALLLDSFKDLVQPYGRLLLAKTIGFGVLLGLASINKWRFTSRLVSGDAESVIGFRRTVAAEWWIIHGVIAATAVMTTLFSPAA
jgi:putative copper export protein